MYKNVATMFDEASTVADSKTRDLSDRNNQSTIKQASRSRAASRETRSGTYRLDCVQIVRVLQNRGKFLLSPLPNLPLSHLIVGGSNTRSFRVGGSTRATKLATAAAAADSISPVENFHGEITMSTTSFLRE